MAKTTKATARRKPVTEAEVVRLTRRLMRRLDKRPHRLLVDYGWEQVAMCVLGARWVRSTHA